MIAGDREMWAYDGRGWWLLEDGSVDDYYWPVSIMGFADDADLFAGRGTTNQDATTWQFFPNSTNVGMRDSFTLITALMDAGERDLDKVWRRAGVELATPDDRATADTVTVTLSYSVDGGSTWTDVATDTLDNTDSRLVSIGGSITARPTSRFLQLKVAVSSVSAWCPVIVGLWAEHETMDLPTRRRRWRFSVLCADQVIERDGSVDTTGGARPGDWAVGYVGRWVGGDVQGCGLRPDDDHVQRANRGDSRSDREAFGHRDCIE